MSRTNSRRCSTGAKVAAALAICSKLRPARSRHQRRRHDVFVVVTAAQAKVVDVQNVALFIRIRFAVQPCAGRLVRSAEPDGFRLRPAERTPP